MAEQKDVELGVGDSVHITVTVLPGYSMTFTYEDVLEALGHQVIQRAREVKQAKFIAQQAQAVKDSLPQDNGPNEHGVANDAA